MNYTLRDYQAPAVQAAFNFVQYVEGNGYITAAGGSGKSVMIAALADRLVNAGYHPVILARNEKLLRQNKDKLPRPELATIYCAGIGEKDLGGDIIIASVQSIAGQIIPPHREGRKLICLVDECDEIHPDENSDTQYWQFFRANGNPRIIGFTATPYRTATGLIKWGREITNIPIAPLIKRGFLCPPINKIGEELDLSSVGISMGEYKAGEIEAIYDDPRLLRKSVEKILDYSAARRANLIFTQSLRHADAVANALEWASESTMVVSGDTCKEELNNVILPAHERGEFKHLINCQLLTVGADMPWIDMITLLMATKSKRKFEQAVYRGTRTFEGKKNFILLDMGNNLLEHGALGSPYRGGGGKREAVPSNGKICPQCETWVEKQGATECPDCAFQFPPAEAPKVSHSSRPDTESATYYGAGGESDIQIHDVRNVTYKQKKSKKGDEMIVVEYHCDYGKYGTLAEYLIPHHSSDWLRDKAKAFFTKRGDDIYGDLREYPIVDLIWRAENNLKKPTQITVNHAKEFPEITRYEWGEQLNMGEILEGDYIDF